MSAETKILVVDDHALVRGALAERLRMEPGFRVVGNAATADEAIEMLLECNPDVVLMDIDMPGLSCFTAARTMSELRPGTSIIFLSAFLHDKYVEEALAVNAKGYLTKRGPAENVITAIREVTAGGAYFSDEVYDRITVESQGARLGPATKSRKATLTPREIEVLRYVACGMAKKEIAKVMHLSVKTVDRHSSNIMEKLNIHDRVGLARFAIREGLATP